MPIFRVKSEKKFTSARKIYTDGVGRVGDNYLVWWSIWSEMNVLDYISNVLLSSKVHQLDQPSNSCNPDQGYDFRACLKVLLSIFFYRNNHILIFLSYIFMTKSRNQWHMRLVAEQNGIIGPLIKIYLSVQHCNSTGEIVFYMLNLITTWLRFGVFDFSPAGFFPLVGDFVSSRGHRFDLQFLSFPQNIWQEVSWLDVHGTWRHIHKDWLSPTLHFQEVLCFWRQAGHIKL